MNKQEYKQYLKTDHWQKKKRQVKYWHGNKCLICGKKKVDIHHKTYKDLGNENQKYHLVPLCRYHHFKMHELSKRFQISLWQVTQEEVSFARKKTLHGLDKKKRWNKMTPYERKLKPKVNPNYLPPPLILKDGF